MLGGSTLPPSGGPLPPIPLHTGKKGGDGQSGAGWRGDCALTPSPKVAAPPQLPRNEGFGEMLFTHFGVSGPLILSASSFYVKKYDNMPVQLFIDLKPALSKEQLDKRLLRDLEENKNKQFKNALDKLLPAKLIPVIVERSGILPEKKAGEVTRQERSNLIETLKRLCLTVTGTRGFQEAIITQGGVNVKEINPSTMESKLVKGLYFAGEVLDVDAVTGGFNLQVAWSTGALAGMSAAKEKEEN